MFNSLKRYRAHLRKQIKGIKKAGVKTGLQAANLLIKIAKFLAPRKTGATIRGIRKRKSREGWTVESWVSGRFKQNLWVNQTSPFGAPLMVWNNRKPTIYGDGTHRTTGTPRFFHLATMRTRKKYIKLARANTLKALRAKLV